MDEDHLLAVVRYVSLNPVAANLVGEAWEWRWSSVRAHLAGRDDELVTVGPVLQRVPDMREFLRTSPTTEQIKGLSAGQPIRRPLMSDTSLRELERRMQHSILPGRPGRKLRASVDGQMRLVE